MRRDWKVFEKFEQDLIESTPVDYQANLRLIDHLFNQAKSIGVFPLKDPLEGLEVDTERCRIFNSLKKNLCSKPF